MKAVYRFQLETFIPEIEIIAEETTYFRVVPSDLVAVMVEGSTSKVIFYN
jgi:hypothetical protein